MKNVIIFTGILFVLFPLIFLQIFDKTDESHVFLDKSIPFIGGDIPKFYGIDGNGIKVAVIDTGVDFEHPDLYGWGSEGKVVGGINFIQDGELPIDTNGHGTNVAGIIAADGKITGVAPKVKILAYKVSEDGEAVSADLIIKAIEKAIEDGADVINISLGVNKTNSKIDQAVDKALRSGILVVTAAGNDGPGVQTIGSPGRNQGALTVGASYNNLTSSLVATLEVGEKPYTVVPMIGSSKLMEPIHGKIIFGNYGKEPDMRGLNATNSILLVERGSDVEDERIYFSTKEKNASNAGANALIVFNNEPGIFLGELIHEFVESDYIPKIPVVSISREDGLKIKESISENMDSKLHLFYNPDFVAHFSSRGPVSPFYIKPDLVAPGAYINTTKNHLGYNLTSGTSFAAPHVSGAAALLLQKNPNLLPNQIKALLITTTDPVSDAYGKEFSLRDTGSGRLDIARAFQAKLIITPPNFVGYLSSYNPNFQKSLDFDLLGGSLENLEVVFEGPEFLKFSYEINGRVLKINFFGEGNNYGNFEGRIFVIHENVKYVIPFLVYYSEGSVKVQVENETMNFTINHPKDWSFAKIRIVNSIDDTEQIITATPKKNASIPIYENSKYWVEAKINVDNETFEAYHEIEINSLLETKTNFSLLDIPEKQLALVAVIVSIVGGIGIIANRRSKDQVLDQLK